MRGNIIRHPCFDALRGSAAYRVAGDLTVSDFITENTFWLGVYPGMNDAMQGVSDIGMASRALKDSELENGVTPTVIAMDGIAVIVNVENPVDSLTSDQICSIYTGECTDWSEVA